MNNGGELTIVLNIILFIIGVALGAGACYVFLTNFRKQGIDQAKVDAERIVKDAEKEAKDIKRDKILEAKEDILKLKSDMEKDREQRRGELERFERRLLNREENLEKRATPWIVVTAPSRTRKPRPRNR